MAIEKKCIPNAWLRQRLFRLTPERAHQVSIKATALTGDNAIGRSILRAMFYPSRVGTPVRAFGMDFPNPLGLAAGFETSGEGVLGLAQFGFGHIEVGSVTPAPQPPPPAPYLFRLTEDEALVHRAGQANPGADEVMRNLRRIPKKRRFLLGVNLAAQRGTQAEYLEAEYRFLIRSFNVTADYLVVNINLMDSPFREERSSFSLLGRLLRAAVDERNRASLAGSSRTPLLVKFMPGPSAVDWPCLTEVVIEAGMDGMVVSSVTLSKDNLRSPLRNQKGAVSGAPLLEPLREMVTIIRRSAGDTLPLIASGGVFGAEDARAVLAAGATLVQIYSGLIYRGPTLPREIVDGLHTI